MKEKWVFQIIIWQSGTFTLLSGYTEKNMLNQKHFHKNIRILVSKAYALEFVKYDIKFISQRFNSIYF